MDKIINSNSSTPKSESFGEHTKLLGSLLVFLGVAICLLIATRKMGVCWDENIYFSFSDGLISWAKHGFPFDAESLRLAWHANPYANPHPPFMKILSALGAELIPSTFPISYRLGHILFTSLGFGLLFRLLLEEFNWLESIAGVLFILIQPRLFGEFLIATTDGPIAIGWLLLSVLAWRISTRANRQSKKLWIVFFLIHAAISATKITGFIAIIPVLIYFSLRRDFKNLALASLSCSFCILFVLLLSPYGWHQPLKTLSEIFLYFLHRNQVVDIYTYYLGHVFGEHPPWHYFFVMSAATLPPCHLFLCALSVFALRAPASQRLLIALTPGIIIWIGLGILPQVPKHDGVRQFAAFFPFLGLLAWLGSLAILRKISSISTKYTQCFSNNFGQLSFFSLFVIPAAYSIIQIHPFEFSFYNLLVGGLSGAEASGLETTYYLEAINTETLGWINSNLKKNERIAIFPPWPELLIDYQNRKLLRPDLKISNSRAIDREDDVLIVVRRRALVEDRSYESKSALFEKKVEGVSILKIIRLK